MFEGTIRDTETAHSGPHYGLPLEYESGLSRRGTGREDKEQAKENRGTKRIDRGCGVPYTAILRHGNIPSYSGCVLWVVTHSTANGPLHAVIVCAFTPGINKRKTDTPRIHYFYRQI